MDDDMSLLVQFLPSQNRVKISAKYNEHLWLDFCRTNDSYFRYVVKGHYFIISPVGIQDEYSVLSGSIYSTHLQPDIFCRMSRLGRLSFYSCTSKSKEDGFLVPPVFGMDYVLHEAYCFPEEKRGGTGCIPSPLQTKVSMLYFDGDDCVMLLKIGSQPQRIKSYKYDVHKEEYSLFLSDSSSSNFERRSSLFGFAGMEGIAAMGNNNQQLNNNPNNNAINNPNNPNNNPNPVHNQNNNNNQNNQHNNLGVNAVVDGVAGTAPNAEGRGDRRLNEDTDVPISKSLLREVVIRSGSDTKTDIHLICLESNVLIEISYFKGTKSQTYHPRISKVFIPSDHYHQHHYPVLKAWDRLLS